MGVADDPHSAAVLLAETHDSCPGLRRDVVERLLAGVQKPLALEERIPPPDIDVARAAAVRSTCDRPNGLLGAEIGEDLHVLALLDVRTDLDDQVGEALGVRHTCHAPSRNTGTRSPSTVIPSTSTSGLPIMKSTWTTLVFARAWSASSSSGKV